MLIPVEWLGDFIELKEENEKLSDMLTMAGLEVEGTEAEGNEQVFEVNITPNRPDCLSVLGVVRELSALTGRKYTLPEHNLQGEEDCPVKVIIHSPLCRRYAGRSIRGVKIGESPDWMKRRLERSGIRSINNVVDVTNYVLLELGHPLHAFDMDTLSKSTIRVDTMNSVGKFSTLDGVERSIAPETLMIWDGERPVAIAGIMGGLETEVKEDTTNIFLESAYFDPASIRLSSRKLGLKTESSYRFERGTDIEGLVTALDRAAFLIKELCGGVVSDRVDVYPSPYSPPVIRLRYERVRSFLGYPIGDTEIKSIILSLGFSLKEEVDESITIEVPSFRVDISMETDLIEEVARLYGYDRIKSTIPSAPVAVEGDGEALSPVLSSREIKQKIESWGFSEAINYSFMNPDSLDILGIPADDVRRSLIPLLNPLTKEESVLRTTLIPSLLKNALLNIRHGAASLRLYEIGRVFLGNGEKLPDERLHLGCVMFTSPGQSIWEKGGDVFFILKGIVEKTIRHTTSLNVSFNRSEEPSLHPGRSSDIFIDDRKIGFLGILAPAVKDRLEIGDFKPEIGVIEIDIQAVGNIKVPAKKFSSIPRFPASRRDIAILLDRDFPAGRVMELLDSRGIDLIEDRWIFDLYEGKNIPEGKKSLGLSIVYRSPEKTLTDDEVDNLHADIVDFLLRETGGSLRT
ncbi:MAG: phenylalanine--tRNA ligase subunit beta [Nitrospirae bacterium]|nr:MAG: phenylalanine--tRNA ligase subunit beta [Nitrospirota bacterium]